MPSIFCDAPLPELKNEKHFSLVFTHRSAVTIPSSERVTGAAEDYERWVKILNDLHLTLQG